jgi:hypothetical protein
MVHMVERKVAAASIMMQLWHDAQRWAGTQVSIA